MISLPHPYTAGEAERYLARQQLHRERARGAAFAIEVKADGRFRGLVEMRRHESAGVEIHGHRGAVRSAADLAQQAVEPDVAPDGDVAIGHPSVGATRRHEGARCDQR